MTCFLALELDFNELFVDGVVAVLREPRDGAHHIGTHHNPMVHDGVLHHFAINITTRNLIDTRTNNKNNNI